MNKKPESISAKSRSNLEKFKQQARRRVVKRGIVQFRADETMMEQLLRVTEQRKIPLGVLVRSWIAERLDAEAETGKPGKRRTPGDAIEARLAAVEEQLARYLISSRRSLKS